MMIRIMYGRWEKVCGKFWPYLGRENCEEAA